MRTLLERVIPSIPKDKCKIIFQIYLELELRLSRGGGDISSVEAVEKRFREMYPNDDSLDGLDAIRYRYNTLGLSTDELASTGNNIDSSDISSLHTILSDSLFSSQTVRVVGTPMKDESEVPGSVEKYLCVPAFLGKLTAYLPIVSYSISTTQDVETVFETFRSLPMPEKPDGYDEYLKEKETHVTVDTIKPEDGNTEDAEAGENTADGPVSKKRKVMD